MDRLICSTISLLSEWLIQLARYFVKNEDYLFAAGIHRSWQNQTSHTSQIGARYHFLIFQEFRDERTQT